MADVLPFEVDLDDGSPIIDLEPTITHGEDGVVVVDFEPSVRSGPIEAAHDENLAEHMDPGHLAAIGSQVLQMVEGDIDSRREWEERFVKGLKKLGITEEIKGEAPFQGASRVVHPILFEAGVQFQARAIKELFPPKGPVKARILGEVSRDKEDQRERVEDYMNYQYTEEMPEAFEEQDCLLLDLPFSGSAFKKVYVDPTLGRPTTVFVNALDLIVPYNARKLAAASRYTHRIRYEGNELLKLMHGGFYRKIQLAEGGVSPDRTRAEEEIARSEGREETLQSYDNEYEVYEVAINYDLPGFEHTDDDGEPTGIALPYLITIEKESQQVLGIRRNWREDDPGMRKRTYVIHYKFLPGFGFYGLGLIHTIGGLAEAATGSLRALLDSAQFANLPGGFKAKAKGGPSGDVPIAPGQWVDTELTGEDLKKHFMPLQYKEPSTVLFQLLGFLVEAGQRFAGTTEATVGDADNKGPVGTTLALIEQGSKVFSSIHKRLHRAQGEEFRLLKEINADTLVGEYPYQVEGADRYVLPEDFDAIDVVPVSDPNIFSSTQRIAQAQASLQMAESAPDIHNVTEAYRRMYQALDIDDDGLLFDPDEVPRMDPVTENTAMLHGKPVRAFLDQHHEAHMAVHQHWFQQLPPLGQQAMEQAYLAHMGEHVALAYRNQMQAAMGFAIPLPELHGRGPVTYEDGQELPPHVENQIAAAAAQAVSQMLPAPQQAQADPEAQAAEAENARQDQLALADSRRKDAAAAADSARKDAIAQSDMARKDAQSRADLASKDAQTAADIMRQNMRETIAAQQAQQQSQAGASQ